jgi:hypothetical protein
VCKRGFFDATPADGELSCEPCAVGSFRDDITAVTCTPCAASRSTQGAGSTSLASCVCDVGFFTDAALDQCVACGSGSFSATKAATACAPCPAGTRSNPGASSPAECTLCPMLTVASHPGMAECQRCGASSPVGSVSSTDDGTDCQVSPDVQSIGSKLLCAVCATSFDSPFGAHLTVQRGLLHGPVKRPSDGRREQDVQKVLLSRHILHEGPHDSRGARSFPSRWQRSEVELRPWHAHQVAFAAIPLTRLAATNECAGGLLAQGQPPRGGVQLPPQPVPRRGDCVGESVWARRRLRRVQQHAEPCGAHGARGAGHVPHRCDSCGDSPHLASGAENDHEGTYTPPQCDC